jgi:hypothetical protein
MGQAMRYQLVLSTVKQMKVLDLLPILRVADAATQLSSFSIVILLVCAVIISTVQTLLL